MPHQRLRMHFCLGRCKRMGGGNSIQLRTQRFQLADWSIDIYRLKLAREMALLRQPQNKASELTLPPPGCFALLRR
jgi:hypothetical protein